MEDDVDIRCIPLFAHVYQKMMPQDTYFSWPAGYGVYEHDHTKYQLFDHLPNKALYYVSNLLLYSIFLTIIQNIRMRNPLLVQFPLQNIIIVKMKSLCASKCGFEDMTECEAA